jgi:uncharacterized protein YecE (DUF72 family)
MIVGTAGWSIARDVADRFSATGSALERYASVFSGVEINSSFHRPHRPATYERWAASVPEDFRFAVKMPKAVTHERRLRDASELLVRFLDEAGALGEKLGPLLMQLPPSLLFEPEVAEPFFANLRKLHKGMIVCEPRHKSWGHVEAGEVFLRHRIVRVEADPVVIADLAEPKGFTGARYLRLHGSPRVYYSAYSDDELTRLAADLAGGPEHSWCIFDNTASGAALRNALTLLSLDQERG